MLVVALCGEQRARLHLLPGIVCCSGALSNATALHSLHLASFTHRIALSPLLRRRRENQCIMTKFDKPREMHGSVDAVMSPRHCTESQGTALWRSDSSGKGRCYVEAPGVKGQRVAPSRPGGTKHTCPLLLLLLSLSSPSLSSSSSFLLSFFWLLRDFLFVDQSLMNTPSAGAAVYCRRHNLGQVGTTNTLTKHTSMIGLPVLLPPPRHTLTEGGYRPLRNFQSAFLPRD